MAYFGASMKLTGRGAKKAFRLLGRQGKNQGTIKTADFRDQKGIYILYGNYGPHYVGLTKELGLGNRLKDYLFDKHKNKWDRFSWFSFGKVLKVKTQMFFRNFEVVQLRHF
jgi:hypothetical protein